MLGDGREGVTNRFFLMKSVRARLWKSLSGGGGAMITLFGDIDFRRNAGRLTKTTFPF